MPSIRQPWRLVALFLTLVTSLCVGLAGTRAATTRVENTATLGYRSGGEARSVRSNTVAFDLEVAKRPTRLSFRLLPNGFALDGLDCTSDPVVTGTAAPIDAATLATAPNLAKLDIHQALVMVLEDETSNRDSRVREISTLHVEAGQKRQELRLTETGPDTGVFAGGLPAQDGTAPPTPCDITLGRNEGIVLSVDEDEDSFASTASALVDPYGLVFDSASGALVDGARVTVLDENGNPATVYGDDGVSLYPSTMITGQGVTDASGRFYPPDPGAYRFPFIAPGRYHFRIEPPADYTAPSIVDPTTLSRLRSVTGAPFIINEGSYGRAFTVDPDRDFSADIPLDRRAAGTAALLLTKTASVRDASPGDFVQYLLHLTNRGNGAGTDLHVTDTLPAGLRYERGSTRGADEPAVAGDGRTLDFRLAALAAGASVDITYVVTIAPGAPVGEALNRARVAGTGTTPSNDAAASVRIRPLLFSDAMTIVGRVTEGACGTPARGRRGVAGIRLLLEDGTFVVTDREGLYHFEGVPAGRHVVAIDRAGLPASHEPVACDNDTRQAGSATSRFVEGTGGLLRRVDFQLRPTGRVAAVAAPPIAVAEDGEAAGNRDWLATQLAGQSPGIAWLFPAVDHNPRAPAVRVAIRHAPGQRVALTVGGVAVDPLTFDGTDDDKAHDIAVSRWSGIPLAPGINHLRARILDADGRVAATLDRVVTLSGAPAHATFDPAHSRLVADGLNRPLVAVRVVDRNGRPVRAGTPVPFRVDQPYRAAIEATLEQQRQLAGRERADTVATVIGDDGLALIALQPTTQAGTVRLHVDLAEEAATRVSEVRAWLSAAATDWVVVGFGAGTLGHDTLARHGQPLAAGKRKSMVTDGQLAVYAKGRIKGSWLLTMAYDSDRRYDPTRGLLGTIDPDRYYTVYGDGSQQGYDAATRRKLYLRLERRQLYALFGDFETGLTDAQLTRYNRTLNGVKAAYEGDRVRATGFAATTDSRFAHDEIQGSGLSGPYRLRSRGIVPNSDKLRIEVRDRFRSERIVSTTPLARHIDYDIDTDLGTVRFRSPVLSRDADRNPVFIVADYEVEGGRAGRLAAAGRVAATLGRVEIGAAAIRDETAGRATIGGVDVKARIDDATELRAEFASGGRGGLGAGQAMIAEVEHHNAALDLTAYVRRQDAGFGVGQQNLVEAGTAKIGLDARLRLSDTLALTATAWAQDQLDGPGSRRAGEARLERRQGATTMFVGGQFASDRGLDGGNRDSRLLTLGGSTALFADALTIAGQTQTAPGGDDASVDFPVRHQITAGYRITPEVRVLAGYEIAHGADFTARTAQVGLDLAPWTGAKLSGTLNQQGMGENGARSFAQYGLAQSLPLGKQWTLDATLDASSTVRGRIDPAATVTPFQPVASGGFIGQDGADYTAATLGATYRAALWSWNGRVEYRSSELNDRWGLTSNVLRSLGQGRTLASGIKAFRVADKGGAIAASASADVALAWRPLDSRWSLLDRIEFRYERADRGFDDRNVLGVPARTGADQVTGRLIGNLAVNYRTGEEGDGHGFDATLYHGAKYVRGRFADDIYDGFIDVTGFELRRDLGPRVDIGVQGSVQHAWSRGAVAWSGGPSLGVSPAGDLWITAGYNLSGYRDRDFEADRYTRSGPYLTVRLKFDGASLAGAARTLFGGPR